MAIISTGSGAFVLPQGTTAERPSAEIGLFRYNTDYDIVEFYNGSKWIVGQGFTPESAVADPKDILVNTPNAPSGIYWLKDASNNTFQYYVDNENYGGGWIRAQATIGTFTSAVTTNWGNGGGNFLSGASNNVFGTENLNGSNVTNTQATIYGCPAESKRSRILLSQTVYDYFNITECIFVYNNVSYPSAVTCCYLNPTYENYTILSGTAINKSVCANSPNRYSDQNPTSFTYKERHTISTVTNGNYTAYTLFQTWTACSGAITGNISELWIK